MKKNMKKLIPILVSVVIIIATFIPSAMALAPALGEVTPGTGSDPAKNADLYVKELQNQFFTQGLNTSVFSFSLRNRNLSTALNVKISAEGQGDFATKFSIVEGTNTYYPIDTMYDKRDIITSLRVDPSVPDGVYNLNLKIAYKNTDGVDSPAVTETVIIYVDGSNNSRPFVKNVTFDKEAIGKDNKVKITAHLENPTIHKYDAVKVSLRAAESKDFTLYENFQPVYIPAIEPHSSTPFEFSVYVAPALMDGNYPIAFDINFRDPNFAINSYVSALYAQVRRSEDAKTGDKEAASTPRIIVSKYSVDVKEIKAGKDFTLDFTLENTSAGAVGNIKVTVGSKVVTGTGGTGSAQSSGEVFFPAEGSNSFFIESLGSKQTVSKQIKLMAKQDVEPGVYPVMMDIEYEDANAKQLKSEESIAFPVSQEQRLDLVGVNITEMGTLDSPLPVNFQYINKGKATIYNVSVSVEGEFQMEGGDVYIGNLTAGYNDYFDNVIIPKAEGSQKGAIVVKFEDSQGGEKEIKSEFTVEVMAGGMPGDMGGDMIGGMKPTLPDGMMIDPNTGELVKIKSGISKWIIIGGSAIIVVLLAVIFIIIKKKRKMKAALHLLEENDE